MQVKNLLRIIFVSILFGSIIVVGIYAFLRLKSDEEVYQADLFSLVPTDSEFLFYSRKSQNLPDRLPVSLLPDEACFLLAKSLYSACNNDVNISEGNEILLSFKGNDGLIFYRSTSKDIQTWENERIKKQEFLFSPQKEQYKGADISIYLTADDRFFCFTRYRGAFIGSFSKTMIHKALDMYDAQKTLKHNDSFNAALKISGEKVLASCFFRKDNWLSFDLSYNNGNYWFNGCLLSAYTPSEIYKSLNIPTDKHELNPEIIPETTIGLIYTNTSYSQVFSDKFNWKDSLLTRHATGEISLVYYSDTIHNYYKAICIELKDNELFLKELSSNIFQSKKSDFYLKRISDDDVSSHIQEKVYQLSPNIRLTSYLGKIYANDSLDVFAFYKEYLLIAHSTEALENYLSQIKSGRTFNKNPLYKLYIDNKNTTVGLSVLIDKDDASRHPDAYREIIPDYFLQNDKCANFRSFMQFNKEDELIYYNVVMEEK